MISNPTFLPKSMRFEFNNTSKLNFEGNKEMSGLCVQAKTVMDKAKEKLVAIIRETQKPEVSMTKKALKKRIYSGAHRTFHLHNLLYQEQKVKIL